MPPILLDSLFQDLALTLVVPPALPPPPRDEAEQPAWWAGVCASEQRQVAFLDEKLWYAVALTLPAASLPETSGASDLATLVRHLQVTATATFLPPLPSARSSSLAPSGVDANTAGRPVSYSGDTTPGTGAGTGTPGTGGTVTASTTPRLGTSVTVDAGTPPNPNPSNNTNLTVPNTSPGKHHRPAALQVVPSTPVGLVSPGTARAAETPVSALPPPDASQPPATPLPVPHTHAGEERYAGLDGVLVWEGAVEAPDAHKPTIFRSGGVWTAVWRGELPVVYVRTQFANPVLGLTASVTLRELPRRKPGVASDNASIFSATTVRTEEGYEDEELDEVDLAYMDEIDLLGGLVADPMPASRLGPSLRDDLSLRAPQTVTSPVTSSSTPHFAAPSTTLRKSFRRVLSLSPGLRVRMRTLFLPQLLPPGVADTSADSPARRIVLCVEVENGADPTEHGFEVDGVTVDVGGKGAKATAELVCEPGRDASQDGSIFPLRLGALEQYNLLYTVDMASTAPESKREEQRSVSIVLSGRPYRANGNTAHGSSPDTKLSLSFPTAPFQSRWNCSLDLAPFYASLPPPPVPTAPPQRQTTNRLSKPMPAPVNAIAGDKRYSLASLLTHETQTPRTPGPGGSRVVSIPPRQPLGRVISTRGPQSATVTNEGHGLLVSLKLLGPTDSTPAHAMSATPGDLRADEPLPIRALDTFSIEVFVHNRTDAVRRFRLSIPPRDPLEARIRDAWARRRRRRDDEQEYGVDDQVLAALLAQHEAAAPAIIALETDVRCGPLLPGASLAARLRFLALRDGVHRVDKLRLTGVGDDFDFVITPATEVVVGA